MPTFVLTLCFPGSISSEANAGERDEPLTAFEEEGGAIISEGGEGRLFLEEDEDEEDSTTVLGGGEGRLLLEEEEEDPEDPGVLPYSSVF